MFVETLEGKDFFHYLFTLVTQIIQTVASIIIIETFFRPKLNLFSFKIFKSTLKKTVAFKNNNNNKSMYQKRTK